GEGVPDAPEAAARDWLARSEELYSDGSVHGGLSVATGAPVYWRTSSLGSRLKPGPIVFELPMAPALLRSARARPWLPSWIGWGPLRVNSSGPRPACSV